MSHIYTYVCLFLKLLTFYVLSSLSFSIIVLLLGLLMVLLLLSVCLSAGQEVPGEGDLL